MEKIILGVSEKARKTAQSLVMANVRGKSSLTNLISLFFTHVVDQGEPAEVIFWGFSKDFDMVSDPIRLDQMSSIEPDKCYKEFTM